MNACIQKFWMHSMFCNAPAINVYVCTDTMHIFTSPSPLSVDIQKIGASFAAGCLPYFYLPISAMTGRATLTWGDQRTVGGILRYEDAQSNVKRGKMKNNLMSDREFRRERRGRRWGREGGRGEVN